MKEPVVRVGILSEEQIRFVLGESYWIDGQPVSGEQSLVWKSGKILWNGELHDSLLFETDDKDATFTIRDVVIGVNFHWERKENQRFQGNLSFIVEGESVTAINIVAIEDYLSSVIASEMSSSASLALLEAHAVISRSWLLAQIERAKSPQAEAHKASFVETEDRHICWYDREDHQNFDVCADDHCQRYQGVSRAFENIDRVKQAIAATRGQVLQYEGEICDARFSKCCGGIVEEFENCWEDVPVPYLVRLRDAERGEELPDLTQEQEAVAWIAARPEAFCNTRDPKILSQALNSYDQETQDFYRWKLRYSTQELSDLIQRRSGIDFGEILSLTPLKRGASGRIVELKITGSKKTKIIGKELEIRKILSESHLYSSAFYVEKEQDAFVLHGAGWGHGVGLCQIGAAVMGEKGYAYDSILLHYYPGAMIKKLY